MNKKVTTFLFSILIFLFGGLVFVYLIPVKPPSKYIIKDGQGLNYYADGFIDNTNPNCVSFIKLNKQTTICGNYTIIEQ